MHTNTGNTKPGHVPRTLGTVLTAVLAAALALSVAGCGRHGFSTASSAGDPSVTVAGGNTSSGGTSSGGTSGGGTSGSGTSGGAAGLPAANELSPTAQAEYCKRTGPLEVALPSEDGRRQPTADLKAQAQIWAELTSYTPAGLHNDVALLATDYQALADGSRTLPQVDGEVRTSFGRVVDYRNLICLTEEERQKQAGN